MGVCFKYAPYNELAGAFGIGLGPDRPQPTSSTFWRKGTRTCPIQCARRYITNCDVESTESLIGIGVCIPVDSVDGEKNNHPGEYMVGEYMCI